MCLTSDVSWAAAPDTQSLALSDEVGVEYERYPARGSRLLIWLPSEWGVLPEQRDIAKRLASQGIETWLPDLHTAYFLPTVDSSIEEMPAEHIAALIQHARGAGGKRVFVLGNGRGALLALRGARQWQLQHPDDEGFGGAVLISPRLYAETPQPGREGQFMPVVEAGDLPIHLLQPTNSIYRWKLDRIVPALSQGGSDVYVQSLRGVRDRFFFRPDALPEEVAMARRLPVLIAAALPRLDALRARPRRPAPRLAKLERQPGHRLERNLQVYEGDPQPPPLALPDLEGDIHTLGDYRGEVLLINFWASWCPPCVHEMPSMQRLQEQLTGESFRILAVNMAEAPEAVREFLDNAVNVDFQILLDRDGAALGRWKVFAFPTTYVVDRGGRIRFALFGAIEWDKPEVIETLRPLLRE